MLSYALMFLGIAMLAGALGFSGVAGAASRIAPSLVRALYWSCLSCPFSGTEIGSKCRVQSFLKGLMSYELQVRRM